MLDYIKNPRFSSDTGLLILRLLACGLVLYGHGFMKLSVIFGSSEIQFFDPIGIGAKPSFILAGMAEGICAIMLFFGLYSQIVAAVLSINFTVIVTFHSLLKGDSFNGFELPFLYLGVFLALTFMGPGKHSLDNLIKKKFSKA